MITHACVRVQVKVEVGSLGWGVLALEEAALLTAKEEGEGSQVRALDQEDSRTDPQDQDIQFITQQLNTTSLHKPLIEEIHRSEVSSESEGESEEESESSEDKSGESKHSHSDSIDTNRTT